MTYQIGEIHHPYHYNVKIITIQGPGIMPDHVAAIFGTALDSHPPAEQMVALQHALNTAFAMGERNAQSKIRNAIGIRYDDMTGFYLEHTK